ncbi:MAG: PIN domain-containing protein, partial [Persicimonas sp.]
SLINVGEIHYIVAKSRSHERADEIRDLLVKMPIELVSVTDALVWKAAELKSRHPLSYADAFAAALALDKQRTLVTGDREFEAVEAGEGLSIKWLNRQ